MFVIFPVRRFIRIFPFMVVTNIMFLAGAIPARAGRALFTAPKSLVALDLLAFPAMLIGGFFLFALVRQLTKNRKDDDGFNPLCRVGFMAWFMFLMGFGSLAGGAFVGSVGAFDGWPQHPAYAQNYGQQSTVTVQTNAPRSEQATKPGTIYFAPPASPAPAPKAASTNTNALPFYH